MVITVVSASEFSAYEPNAATAVIRIYDPIDAWSEDAAAQVVAGWGKILPIAFWDVGRIGMGLIERAMVRLLGRWRGPCLRIGQAMFGDIDIPWRPFLPADARDICAFADGLVESGIRSILVVCHNGRGRGGTVANCLARYLGIEPPPQRGWQRESDLIAATFARLPPKRGEKARHMANMAAFGI
jgi:hypothetical protein